MVLKVNKCFLSALYDEMQLKMYGFRERKRWRTVNLGNCVGMPMFLYYDHTMNRSTNARLPPPRRAALVSRVRISALHVGFVVYETEPG